MGKYAVYIAYFGWHFHTMYETWLRNNLRAFGGEFSTLENRISLRIIESVAGASRFFDNIFLEVALISSSLPLAARNETNQSISCSLGHREGFEGAPGRGNAVLFWWHEIDPQGPRYKGWSTVGPAECAGKFRPKYLKLYLLIH